MARLLVFVISFSVRVLRAVIRSRGDLVIENVALRQQVATLLSKRLTILSLLKTHPLRKSMSWA